MVHHFEMIVLMERYNDFFNIQLLCFLSGNILKGCNKFMGLENQELEMEVFPLLL